MEHVLLTPVDKEGEVKPKMLIRTAEIYDARRVKDNSVTVVELDGQRFPLWVVETPEEIHGMMYGPELASDEVQ